MAWAGTFSERVAEYSKGWQESLNDRNWELTTGFGVTTWRTLAETTNQWLTKGREVFVEGELRGEASDGSQNPRVCTRNDGVAKASYEIATHTVKFLGSAQGNAGAPVGEPPPEGYGYEDGLLFWSRTHILQPKLNSHRHGPATSSGIAGFPGDRRLGFSLTETLLGLSFVTPP